MNVSCSVCNLKPIESWFYYKICNCNSREIYITRKSINYMDLSNSNNILICYSFLYPKNNYINVEIIKDLTVVYEFICNNFQEVFDAYKKYIDNIEFL